MEVTLDSPFSVTPYHLTFSFFPHFSNDAQRQATKDAGRIAGLEILGVINEPTAASLAYGIGSDGKVRSEQERTIIVYDLGGGTFDVSLLSVEDGVFEVLATSGDTHLGGEDFDNSVFDHMVKQFEKKNDVELSKNDLLKSSGRLRREVERAKRTLSSGMSTKIEIEGFHQGLDLSETLNRAKFGKSLSICALSFSPLTQSDLRPLLSPFLINHRGS